MTLMKDSGERTVPCPLRSAALSSPGAPAIVGCGGTITFAELDRRVTSVVKRIEALDLEDGARFALYLPKSADHVALLLALIRAGHVACPLSTRLPPAGVTPLLRKAGCRALISHNDTPDLAGVRALHPETLLESHMGKDSPPLSDPTPLALDRPATVVFTSGSTGGSKAALHTFGNHYLNAEGSNANITLAPEDRWLLSLPLYHVGGLSILFRCLIARAAVALPEPDATLGEAIAKTGATHVSLVSTQLLRLLREENLDAEKLEAILLGGGPMPASLLDEAVSRSLPVFASYGLTEMASQVTATRRGASREELRTAGRPLPHREVGIAGNGEILVRGETLFAGYLDGERLDLPLDEDGWFRTNDLGELDENCNLRVRGRRDNLFISGGENIQPEEIEETLIRLEGIEEAVVVPVPDEEFGERPVAFVRTDGRRVQPESLVRDLENLLPRYKIPRTFHAWPGDSPREGMKVDRTLFRNRARGLHSDG